VGGKDVVIQIAPPSRFSKRKLARIYEHELRHIEGLEHEEMTEKDLWSEGPEPEWSRGMKVRRRKRRGDEIEEELK